VLAELVREGVNSVRHMPTWRTDLEAENEERRQMRLVCRNWEQIVDDLPAPDADESEAGEEE
jgi:hypothetical protein